MSAPTRSSSTSSVDDSRLFQYASRVLTGNRPIYFHIGFVVIAGTFVYLTGHHFNEKRTRVRVRNTVKHGGYIQCADISSSIPLLQAHPGFDMMLDHLHECEELKEYFGDEGFQISGYVSGANQVEKIPVCVFFSCVLSLPAI
jgi:hypothetical protein